MTEMGETGQSGRFQILTNLTPEMYSQFKISITPDGVNVVEKTASLPYVIDGAVSIGPDASGDYTVAVGVKGHPVWKKDGVIRVIRPSDERTGLIQSLKAADEYCRPGETVVFEIHGSGFRPEDAAMLQAHSQDLSFTQSEFRYLAPGRMELTVTIPPQAAVKTHGLLIKNGDILVKDVPQAFRVVPKNWVRQLKLSSSLIPGGKSQLLLQGRDLSADILTGLNLEVDQPGLMIGVFKLKGSHEAAAPIEADAAMKPGDYLLHLTVNGVSVVPETKSLIRISSNN
jgi:hypothetical protein